MKYGIVGSRAEKLGKMAKTYERAVKAYVRSLPRHFMVVTGGATGVDRWAEEEAVRLGMKTQIFPVDRVGLPPFGLPGSREEFARRAHARNQQIVDFSDAIIAFWDGKSPGTRDCLKRAANGEYDKSGRIIKAPLPWAILTPVDEEKMAVRVSEGLRPRDLYILKETGH